MLTTLCIAYESHGRTHLPGITRRNTCVYGKETTLRLLSIVPSGVVTRGVHAPKGRKRHHNIVGNNDHENLPAYYRYYYLLLYTSIIKKKRLLTLLAPHSHMWGQSTLTVSSLSPKREWGPKRVKIVFATAKRVLPLHSEKNTRYYWKNIFTSSREQTNAHRRQQLIGVRCTSGALFSKHVRSCMKHIYFFWVQLPHPCTLAANGPCPGSEV